MSLLHNKVPRLLGAALLCFLVFSSCRPTHETQVLYRKTPSGVWEQSRGLRYRFLVTEAHRPYQLTLWVRHNNNVPFCDLYLVATLMAPKRYYRCDTLHIPLSLDGKRWQGSGVMLTELDVPYLQAESFPYTGFYTLVLTPYSHSGSVQGVENIALAVSRLGASF